MCSDELFALNISRFINQSDPWSLRETRYQKAHFQLQSWQKSYLGSWPRYSVTSCFKQVWLLAMSSLGYPALSRTVKRSELKQALILSSQAERCVLGAHSPSDSSSGEGCQAKRHRLRGWAWPTTATCSTEVGNTDKPPGCGSPCSCPSSRGARPKGPRLVAERAQRRC